MAIHLLQELSSVTFVEAGDLLIPERDFRECTALTTRTEGKKCQGSMRGRSLIQMLPLEGRARCGLEDFGVQL